jgi:hypothetical protein
MEEQANQSGRSELGVQYRALILFFLSTFGLLFDAVSNSEYKTLYVRMFNK